MTDTALTRDCHLLRVMKYLHLGQLTPDVLKLPMKFHGSALESRLVNLEVSP